MNIVSVFVVVISLKILNKIMISVKYEFLSIMHINNSACSKEYELIEIHLCYNTP